MVIRMEENDSPYPMLLGRPWFTQAKLKMDWGKCQITIRRGKKKIRLDMVPTTLLPVHARALHAEPISVANSIEDDEEEAFLHLWFQYLILMWSGLWSSIELIKKM